MSPRPAVPAKSVVAALPSIVAALKDAERELADLHAKRDALDARIAQVEPAVAALRRLTGHPAPATPRRRTKATGTAAIILDILADGQRRSCGQIATEAKVKANAARRHLQNLVEAGDVDAQGSTWTRTYGIP